jgi:ubiquinone/menaquinone biosynthesis C-methylase UbiE
MTEGSPVRVSVSEGYTIWAKTYDTTWNTLIATEELYSLGLLDSLTGTTALDVGAGTGRYAVKLARKGWDVTAVDANPAMLGVARSAAGDEGLPMRFLRASIEDSLPAGSGAFDLVVCALTLCHVAGLQGAMAEFHRVLVPGGHLLVTNVHPDFISAGMPTQFVDDGVTYHLPNEPRTRDD